MRYNRRNYKKVRGHFKGVTVFEIIASIILLIILLSLCVLWIIYYEKDTTVAFICLGAFAGIILSLAIILNFLIPKIRVSRIKKYPHTVETKAIVYTCKFISGSKYKVVMNIADSEERTYAYSKGRKYEEGEELIIRYIPKKPKYCIIIKRN